MYLEDDTYRAKDEVSMTLKHNAEGFVTQLVENHKLTSNRPGSQVDYVNNIKDYSYQNGNLTQVICTSNLPSEEYVMKYAHYLDKPNVLTVNSDLDYLFTKPDKNLVKQVEVTFDGDLYFSYRQDYQFDAEGLIKKIRFVELDQDGNSYDDQAGESFIDYQCK